MTLFVGYAVFFLDSLHCGRFVIEQHLITGGLRAVHDWYGDLVLPSTLFSLRSLDIHDVVADAPASHRFGHLMLMNNLVIMRLAGDLLIILLLNTDIIFGGRARAICGGCSGLGHADVLFTVRTRRPTGVHIHHTIFVGATLSFHYIRDSRWHWAGILNHQAFLDFCVRPGYFIVMVKGRGGCGGLLLLLKGDSSWIRLMHVWLLEGVNL